MDQLFIRYVVPVINSNFSGFARHLSGKLGIDESIILDAINSYQPNEEISPAFKDLQLEIQSGLDKRLHSLVGNYRISMGLYDDRNFLIWGGDTNNISNLIQELGGRWRPVFCGNIPRVWQFNDNKNFDKVKQELELKTGAIVTIDNRYYNTHNKNNVALNISNQINSAITTPLDSTVIKPSEMKKNQQLPPKKIIKPKIPENTISKPPLKSIKLGKVQKCKDGNYYSVDHGFIFKNLSQDPKKLKPFCIGIRDEKDSKITRKLTVDNVETLDILKIKYDSENVELLEEDRDYISSDNEEEEDSEYDETSEGESDGEEET